MITKTYSKYSNGTRAWQSMSKSAAINETDTRAVSKCTISRKRTRLMK